MTRAKFAAIVSRKLLCYSNLQRNVQNFSAGLIKRTRSRNPGLNDLNGLNILNVLNDS